VFNALMGPMIIYFALMAHVMYHHFIQAPGALTMTDFSADVPKDLREATIKARKGLIKSHLDVYSFKADSAAYLKNIATADYTFEDPLQFIEDRSAWSKILAFFGKTIDSVEADVRGEHHGPNEVVLDLTFNMKLDFFGMKVGPLSLAMRQHIMLEPAAKAGGPEKIFSVREDWGGNVIMNEDNSQFKPLGRVHKMLRRFVGIVGSKIATTLG